VPEAWINQGLAYRGLGKSKQSLYSFDQAINLSPQSSVAWNGKGEYLFKLHKLPEALECLNRSVQLDSGSPVAWYNLGTIYLGMSKYNQALECYNRSITLDLYNAMAWNNKGVSFAKLGNNMSALSCFKKAAILDPKFEGAFGNCVLILRGLGLENSSENAYFTSKKLKSPPKIYFQAATMTPAFVDMDEDAKGQTKKSPGLDAASAILVLVLVWAGLFLFQRGRR